MDESGSCGIQPPYLKDKRVKEKSNHCGQAKSKILSSLQCYIQFHLGAGMQLFLSSCFYFICRCLFVSCRPGGATLVVITLIIEHFGVFSTPVSSKHLILQLPCRIRETLDRKRGFIE